MADDDLQRLDTALRWLVSHRRRLDVDRRSLAGQLTRLEAEIARLDREIAQAERRRGGLAEARRQEQDG